MAGLRPLEAQEALRYFFEPATSTINIPTDDRISMDDAIKAINDFAKCAYEHKMGL